MDVVNELRVKRDAQKKKKKSTKNGKANATKKKPKKNGRKMKKKKSSKKDKRKKLDKKKKDKTKKKNKNKNKIKNKKKKKKNQKKKKDSKQSSCSATQANKTCVEAAIQGKIMLLMVKLLSLNQFYNLLPIYTGMLFEANQITNYLKQSKLLTNHQKFSTNKANKKGNFELAKEHLLWAIGGNFSNPKCGSNDTSSSKYNRLQ